LVSKQLEQATSYTNGKTKSFCYNFRDVHFSFMVSLLH